MKPFHLLCSEKSTEFIDITIKFPGLPNFGNYRYICVSLRKLLFPSFQIVNSCFLYAKTSADYVKVGNVPVLTHWMNRSSHRRGSLKNGVLINIANLTGKHLCWSLILESLQACNFTKKGLQHRCFPVKFAKDLRTPISKNICERVLLDKDCILRALRFSRHCIAINYFVLIFAQILAKV